MTNLSGFQIVFNCCESVILCESMSMRAGCVCVCVCVRACARVRVGVFVRVSVCVCVLVCARVRALERNILAYTGMDTAQNVTHTRTLTYSLSDTHTHSRTLSLSLTNGPVWPRNLL
jgi:hypothetical protein